MVPHGNTPEPIKKNPKLQGVEIPNTGAPTQGTGLLVTSTLLFGGEGGNTPVLRAWDKKTGAVVAEIPLPGPRRIPRHLYEGRTAASPWRHAGRCGQTWLAVGFNVPTGREGRGGDPRSPGEPGHAMTTFVGRHEEVMAPRIACLSLSVDVATRSQQANGPRTAKKCPEPSSTRH